ncbi:tRNA (guanine37-N1)-methyltransferase [Natranaerovirga pectinivora]|uniref:tRNA (guanine-N(1)-)-methyltransferase n=1 Tax=Natranaerovirga pectinivora TaxID=682400 RepID=A0A4V2V0M6_9FIRM|nr:tRNA (guanosine(37)-N1)-methyltransferase TrmD [Natranaerovirga pectinivora]TCT16979.1 tRNA (guanine37-N1)-methyltransferase [Natranaerovirga pectinivora]
MNYHIFTLFPEMIEQGLNTSIIGRAIEKGIIDLNLINIREFSTNKHKKVDDYPYGGGAGMVMQPEPIYNAYKSVMDTKVEKKTRLIYLTPQGKVFNQKMAEEFSKEESLMFLCGHYEGVDERVLETIVTDYVSIGDYVLTGGELAVMVLIDAISRLIPGVLSNNDSADYESFQDGLLEYPQYTRPYDFMGKTVPDVLISGHHANITKWRKEQSLSRTLERRPDLINKAHLTEEEKKYLKNIANIDDL